MQDEEGKPMSRRGAVRLVSRALSIIYAVFATYETTYLPERLFSYLHYDLSPAIAPGGSTYLPTLYRISMGFLFLRIAIYLALAVSFWNCPSWVERVFETEREL